MYGDGPNSGGGGPVQPGGGGPFHSGGRPPCIEYRDLASWLCDAIKPGGGLPVHPGGGGPCHPGGGPPFQSGGGPPLADDADEAAVFALVAQTESVCGAFDFFGGLGGGAPVASFFRFRSLEAKSDSRPSSNIR